MSSKASRWNHNCCWQCWVEREYDSETGSLKMPIRITNGSEVELEDVCCFCNQLNIEGIYTRIDPATTPCEGEHKED